MKIAIFVVVIGMLGTVAFFFLRSDSLDIKNYPPDGTKVVAFGDSLVTGYGSENGGFVHFLSEDIGIPIVNLGKNGDTTADALLRIGKVYAENPDIVIVLLGGNDFLRRVPPEETFANLAKIITDLQERGAVIVLLGVRGGLLYDSYDNEFESFAHNHGVAFVPNVLDGLLGNPELMYDQIHPNDIGYRRIARKVEPVLRSVLPSKE